MYRRVIRLLDCQIVCSHDFPMTLVAFAFASADVMIRLGGVVVDSV